MKKTITQALQESARMRDTARFNKLLDQIANKGRDVMGVPMVCDVNRVGYEAHRWAWDQLEDWQNA